MMAGNNNLLAVVKWGHLLGGCRISIESKARKHSSNLVRDWESKTRQVGPKPVTSLVILFFLHLSPSNLNIFLILFAPSSIFGHLPYVSFNSRFTRYFHFSMQFETCNVRAEEISLALFGLSVTIWSGLLTMRRRMGLFTQCTSGRVFKAYYLRQGHNLDTFLKVIWV